jgi:hypothetical protein
MGFSSRDLLLLAVHGEGDRAKLNEMADVERRLKLQGMSQTAGRDIPADMLLPADVNPEVTIILRDRSDPDQPCIQYVLRTWDEVEGFKAANGGQHWDEQKKQFVFSKVDADQGRHMPFGTVKVTFE